jgi:hypothetical protein
MPGPNRETRVRFCDGLANIVVQYSIGPIITLHGQITAREYVDRLGNQGRPMFQMLFPNNVVVFQDNNASIHTAGTVQSRFEEHEGELQHLSWSAQSHLNITEPLWSDLETRLRNKFPPPTSLKQPEDVLHGEWYKIPLQTLQACTSPFREGLLLYWR